MQKNKFNQSIEDINDFFSLLEFIDSIETYKNIMLPNPTTTSSLLDVLMGMSILERFLIYAKILNYN